MKTILAATDFSATARNAVNYAAEMAINLKAKLVLLHVYSLPIITDAPMPAYSLDDFEKDCNKRLKRIASTLLKNHGKKLQVECICRCGFAVDEISAVCKEVKTDLLIMGMQGAGYLAEKVNGSVTTAMMTRVGCPVLSVDKKVEFTKPKKIVLATDLKEIKHTDFAKVLGKMAEAYKAQLLILNVFKPDEVMPTASEANASMKLDHLLKNMKHSFHYSVNKDVVQGINDFVTKEKANVVVMIARKHSFFKKIFNEPMTKRMAFHTHTPLLTFHE